MPQQFLYGTNVVASLQQVSGETMPKRVATAWLGNTSFADGAVNSPLQNLFINVMAPD
jgi:hypothetical protein